MISFKEFSEIEKIVWGNLINRVEDSLIPTNHSLVVKVVFMTICQAMKVGLEADWNHQVYKFNQQLSQFSSSA